jgi:hypothetical protein
VKRHRRLRRLVPDANLIRRRAAGDSLRALALEYGVTHTTLLRYFDRPDVAQQLKLSERQLRAEQRAAVDRCAAERRLKGEVRRMALEQAARERKEARARRRAALETTSRRPSSEYAAWLDERDARTPLTRADLHSPNDEIAAGVVAEGGGMQAVIDATGLRTLENVVNLIDRAILKQALDNDVLEQAAESQPV